MIIVGSFLLLGLVTIGFFLGARPRRIIRVVSVWSHNRLIIIECIDDMPELKSVQFGRFLTWLRKPVVKRIDMIGGESYIYVKYENEATNPATIQ